MKLKIKVDTDLDKNVLYDVARKVLWKAANKIEEIAKIKAPVDTGRLRASIKIFPLTPGQVTYDIGDGVKYGVYLEVGTRYMKAQPFLVPALREVQKEWIPIYWREFLS